MTSRPQSAALAALLLFASPALAGTDEDAALRHARELLASTILIDGHNDLPWVIREWAEAPMDVEKYDLRKSAPHETDLARLRAGGVGAQFWSVYVPGEIGSGFARVQLERLDNSRRMIARVGGISRMIPRMSVMNPGLSSSAPPKTIAAPS